MICVMGVWRLGDPYTLHSLHPPLSLAAEKAEKSDEFWRQGHGVFHGVAKRRLRGNDEAWDKLF